MSPTIHQSNFFVTGENICDLLKFLPGEIIHRVPRAEDLEKSEVNIYQKQYKSYYEKNLDFYEIIQFSFILPPPYIHINNLKLILKNREPRGILFLLNPSKPVGTYQALIERLFNSLIDALGVEFESIGPFNDIPLTFGVILVNFEEINFDFRVAKYFLQQLYPVLYRYTEKMTNTSWFEGIFTPHVDPLNEIRKIFNQCAKSVIKTKTEEEIDIIETNYKNKLEEILGEASKLRLAEIPLKYLEKDIHASSAWLLRAVRNILSEKDYSYKMLGTKIIALDPKVIKDEILQIEEEVVFLTNNKPKSTGILNYLVERSENLKNIVNEGEKSKVFTKDDSEIMIEKLFKAQIDLQNLNVEIQFSSN
ncbi:MAG: hypothetical protein HeimC3_54060 [Candidatus Heimdallarchaeota archaeon LC_3]|nr:MAG: hypothetical protein HeimC3_54060 [Candidatus Heimdallarchaeota archaeon LC_3]